MSEDLLAAAVAGDRSAFDELAGPVLGPLRSFILRMVAHVDDAEELTQDVLVKAHQGLGAFRADASFKTWLFSIATRTVIDHLRKKKRWSVEAQNKAAAAMYDDPEVVAQFGAATAEPDFVFSVREHIAFCFSCLGRSLEPVQSAVLQLREVYGFQNREAAKMLEMSESVFRHHLASARAAMQEAYEGLCALVNKTGVCYQCSGLRDLAAPEKRGEALVAIGTVDQSREERFNERLRIVRDADLADGTSAPMHRVLFKFVGSLEGEPG